MAIIFNHSRIINYNEFLNGLSRAAQGIIYVTQDTKIGAFFTTGWLITDTLVVLLSLEKEGVIHCQPSLRPDDIIEAEHIGGSLTPERKPILLRLHKSLSGCALTLADRSPEMGDQVYLLHHPEGQRELALSLGDLLAVKEQVISYNADTLPGSSGAPIFNTNSAIIGMHSAARRDRSSSSVSTNEGIPLAAILDELRKTQYWPEIAQYHNLADVTSARMALANTVNRSVSINADIDLVRAAVYWSFDPTSLPKDELEKLSPLVINQTDQRWILSTKERQRILRSVSSLDVLRVARGDDIIDDPRQQVIDAILAGPPYNLEGVADDALPYWLQAVRWFAGLEPSLPMPTEVDQTLARRRVRGRLRDIVGPDFQGRTQELATLKTWYADKTSGPMTITGIGGIGKSALVAQFALGLSKGTPLFWLDFDRADVAPDDAVSVLRLLYEQAAVQIEHVTTPPIDASSWKEAAHSFGAALVAEAPASLLVLDGFEVAQHVQRYDEIWQLLEQILAQAPDLRILISGRAPVTDLTLNGRPATLLTLAGLARPDARAWLRKHGITDKVALARVLDISNGVPLVLMLAAQWIGSGGEIQELPDALPKVLVEGFLYQRILDRVIDPVLKPVAHDILVLRRFTVEMLAEIVRSNLPEGLDSQEVFARLAREMALIQREEGARAQPPPVLLATDSSVLRLRPELRLATLRLLEIEDIAHVRMIDERAAAWYAKQDLNEAVNAAELVYHRLRLGDIMGAEAVWTEACAPLLLYAEGDLPEEAKAERAWLRKRTRDISSSVANLKMWESEAVERIRAALSRQLLRVVPAILAERSERSSESPLVLYDAWLCWQNGDATKARALLRAGSAIKGPVGRDQAVLAALLAAQENDQAEADRLLADIEDEEQWRDRADGLLAAIAVRSARVQLTVDLAKESALFTILRETPSGVSLATVLKRFLPSPDVILSLLARWMADEPSSLEITSVTKPMPIPSHPAELQPFAHQVDQVRQAALSTPTEFFLSLTAEDSASSTTNDPWQASDLAINSTMTNQFQGQLVDGLTHGLNLAILGWRRWRIATSTLFLDQACRQVLQSDEIANALQLSILGTLALFQGNEQSTFMLHFQEQPLTDLLDKAMLTKQFAVELSPTVDRIAFAAKVFHELGETDPASAAFVAWLDGVAERTASSESRLSRVSVPSNLLRNLKYADWRGLCLYLLSPKPLEALVQRLVGSPDSFNLD